MSLERVIRALERLGLTRLQSEVYIYAAKTGSQTILEMCEALNYSKKQINVSLKALTEKALIIEKGTKFYAIPFEEALELLLEKEKQQARFVQNLKEEIVDWS